MEIILLFGVNFIINKTYFKGEKEGVKPLNLLYIRV